MLPNLREGCENVCQSETVSNNWCDSEELKLKKKKQTTNTLVLYASYSSACFSKWKQACYSVTFSLLISSGISLVLLLTFRHKQGLYMFCLRSGLLTALCISYCHSAFQDLCIRSET